MREAAGFFVSCSVNDALASEIRPTSSPVKDDGEFLDLGWRLIFAEHTDRSGTKFDGKAMRRIAARCNDRIEETGDFPPVSVRHNGKDSDREVVGFMGPFKTGMTGKKNRRVGIYGRFRVFREDYQKVRKHPRISVEYWGDRNDHTNGIFDPISLLGSETPELDLGIHYSKDASDRVCVKYSRLMHYAAASPGATNVVLPAHGEEKKTYEKATGLMISPEDLNQIVAALTPVIQAKIAEMNPAPQIEDAMPDTDLAPEVPGEEVPPVDAPPDADAPPVEDAEVGDEQPTDAEPVAPPVEDKPADEKPEEDESPVAKKYQRERDEYQVKYQKAVTELREKTEAHDALAAIVESSKREARRAVRYQKLSDLAAQGFVIVPKDDIAEVQDLSEEQFSKFTDTVVKKYQRIPLNMLPVPKGIETDSDGDKKRAQYMKEAETICEAATKAGKHIPFREAVETVRKSYEKTAA